MKYRGYLRIEKDGREFKGKFSSLNLACPPKGKKKWATIVLSVVKINAMQEKHPPEGRGPPWNGAEPVPS